MNRRDFLQSVSIASESLAIRKLPRNGLWEAKDEVLAESLVKRNLTH